MPRGRETLLHLRDVLDKLALPGIGRKQKTRLKASSLVFLVSFSG